MTTPTNENKKEKREKTEVATDARRKASAAWRKASASWKRAADFSADACRRAAEAADAWRGTASRAAIVAAQSAAIEAGARAEGEAGFGWRESVAAIKDASRALNGGRR